MTHAPIFIDDAEHATRQEQIRRRMVAAVAAGVFPPGARAPSSRALARQLGVARNTVVLAFQALVSEGVLVGKERSGLFINPDVAPGAVGVGEKARPVGEDATVPWSRHLAADPQMEDAARGPANWQGHPYPFIDGFLDASLFPLSEWRESVRQALSVRGATAWATDQGDADDPELIEQIRTKLLPRRGIAARSDEIIVTLGRQQALSLACQMFALKGRTVGVEEPGSPEIRELARGQGASVRSFAVDEAGLIPVAGLSDCDLVAVTPSHQLPTGATLTRTRREDLLRRAEANDFLILEDDVECETAYEQHPLPAMRGMAGGRRVIYVAGLSKVFEPGLRLGFMVADPQVIARARRLRRLSAGHPPLLIERAAAIFLAQGAYDATLRRVGAVFRERRLALRDALNHYLRKSIVLGAVSGGTTYWVKGPKSVDARYLAAEAANRGVLIEPVDRFYSEGAPRHLFRVSVTGLPIEQIRGGVAALAEIIRDLASNGSKRSRPLSAEKLASAMPGARFLFKTVYGDPCTIELQPDGEMRGRAGHAGEDCDTGRWWLEDDLWCRRWESWAYGEVSKFRVAIDGSTIRWIRPNGRELDSAHYVPPGVAPDVDP